MEIAFSCKVHSCYYKFLVEKTNKQNKSLWHTGPLEKYKDAYKIIKKFVQVNMADSWE